MSRIATTSVMNGWYFTNHALSVSNRSPVGRTIPLGVTPQRTTLARRRTAPPAGHRQCDGSSERRPTGFSTIQYRKFREGSGGALAAVERVRERVQERLDELWGVRPAFVKRAVLLAIALVVWLILDNVLGRGLPVGILILGGVFGSLYALTAVGIVLIYRANRVVNFAQAELGGIAAVIAIQLVLQFRWNYFASIAIGLVGSTVIGGLIYLFVIRRFKNAPRLILAVATIGIAQILAGGSIIVSLLFQGQPASRTFETPFTLSFTVFPVIFRGDHVLAMLVVPIVMVGLAAFLRYTDYGIAIRAAAENGERANLLGVPIHYLHLMVWAIAGFLSATAALLRVPIVGFSALSSVTGAGNSLLLRTLAAAVIGRMENIPRTVAAALALGVIQESLAWTYSNTDIVDALLVVLILGVAFAPARVLLQSSRDRHLHLEGHQGGATCPC